jgi:hypothetical protein
MLGGRTGAEAKLHAVSHLLERTRRRLPFEFFHIHARAYVLETLLIGRPGVRAGHI